MSAPADRPSRRLAVTLGLLAAVLGVAGLVVHLATVSALGAALGVAALVANWRAGQATDGQH